MDKTQKVKNALKVEDEFRADKDFIKKLSERWKSNWGSLIVPKKEIAEFTGGLLQPQTMTNLVALGKAPKPFYVRGRAVFEVDVLLDWLLVDITGSYEGFEIRKHTPHSSE